MAYFSHLYQELKLAFLSLKRVPGFVVTVVATLSITLGALICIFNLNHLLLGKAFPFPNEDKLLVLGHVVHFEGKEQSGSSNLKGMLHWYKQQQSLASMALILRDREVLASHPEQPRVSNRYVTPEYFQLLAAPMALGRGFSADEGVGSQQKVAVLSHFIWQKWFDGRKDILEQKLQIGDRGYKIVGVTSADFHAPQLTDIESQDIWLSWDANPKSDLSWGTFMSSVKAIGLLKDGVTQTQAKSDLGILLNNGYQASDINFKGEVLSAELLSLKQAVIGDNSNIALLLMAGSLVLLLIAVANVINLFLSRATEKRRTLAIQAAVGARPGQLFTTVFAESLLLCLASSLLAMLLAGWGFILIKELANNQLPRLNELGLDGITVCFSVFVGLMLALVFARLSQTVVNYDTLKDQLQSSGKGSGVQIAKGTRNTLVVAQVALASLLLIGSAVVMEQAIDTINKPLGFNSENLSNLTLDIGNRYKSRKEQYALSREIKGQLAKMPQVQAVSRVISAPIRPGLMRIGLNDDNMQRLGSFRVNLIDSNYFELMQLPLLQGRTFTPIQDDEDAAELVVSESLARRLAPDGDILGKVFKNSPDQPMKVVGVASDYFNPGDMEQGAKERYYMPYFPIQAGFQLKLAAGASLNKQQVLNVLQQIDPQLRINEFVGVNDAHQDLIFRHKVSAGITFGLTLLALLLAGAGIYGVLSYATQMRRYELGIHMALGARTNKVKTMVMKESLTPVAIGLISGLVLALLLYGLARQQIELMIQPNVLALVLAFPLMIITATLACYLPVRKVIVEDPVKALRNE